MGDPNRNTRVAQLDGTPRRRYYTGGNLARAVAIEDLRATTHRRMPRFVLEYLEGGAEEEATLVRERTAYAEWLLHAAPAGRRLEAQPRDDDPRQRRGGAARRRADRAQRPVSPWRRHRARRRPPPTPACRSCRARCRTTPWRTSPRSPNLRHWWQLYVFGGDEVWQELLRRADARGLRGAGADHQHPDLRQPRVVDAHAWRRKTRPSRRRPCSKPRCIRAGSPRRC